MYYRLFSIAGMLLVLLLFTSCSSSKPQSLSLNDTTAAQWDKTVDNAIPQADRAARVKQLGYKLITISKNIMSDIDTLNAQTEALNKRYDARQSDLSAIIAHYRQKRDAAFKQYGKIVFAMRAEVSEQEWKELFND
jgi:hypothetical protein